MAEDKHPCENGLTEECFRAYPLWAKRAFALKLMHTLFPGEITRRLPKGLRPGMIGFPPGWTPGLPLPPYLDPKPTPGITVPTGGAIPPIFVTPFEPGPPHNVSPTAPGVTVVGTFTAQNDARVGRFDPLWNTAHGAATGNMIPFPETETDRAVSAHMSPPDWYIWRAFFDFDLSTIPVSATLKTCKLTLQSYGAATCDASIQEGTQSDSLVLEDYDAFTGYKFDSLTWAIGENVFTMNVPGKIYAQGKFGDTVKLCMREYYHDYLDIATGVGENFSSGLYWSGAAIAANRPKLTVKYKT